MRYLDVAVLLDDPGEVVLVHLKGDVAHIDFHFHVGRLCLLHLPEGPWAPSDAREAQRISGKSLFPFDHAPCAL